MIDSIVLVPAIHQHEWATGTHVSLPRDPPSLPPHPSRLPQSTGRSCCVTQHTPMAPYFPRDEGYVSTLPSQLIPPSPSPTVSTSLLTVSASPSVFSQSLSLLVSERMSLSVRNLRRCSRLSLVCFSFFLSSLVLSF